VNGQNGCFGLRLGVGDRMQSIMRIRLPFRLAVPSGQTFLSGYENGDHKWRHRITFNDADFTISSEGWMDEPLPVTVATVWTDINIEEVEPGWEPGRPPEKPYLRVLFLLTLDYLNQFVHAYRIVEQDYTVRTISLTDLPEGIEMIVDGRSYLYVVNLPHWVSRSDEAHEDALTRMKRIGGMVVTRDRWPQYVNIQQFYASARHYMEQGNYTNAAIELETAFEMQVRLALRLALTENNIPEPKYSNSLETPLRNAVEELLPKYLGGNFSLKSPGPIADWFQYLYLLRNACVHEGRTNVSGDEATAAIDAYHAATDHLARRLVAHGILSDKKEVEVNRYAPRRNVELHPDILLERFQGIGLLEDHWTAVTEDDESDSPETE